LVFAVGTPVTDGESGVDAAPIAANVPPAAKSALPATASIRFLLDTWFLLVSGKRATVGNGRATAVNAVERSGVDPVNAFSKRPLRYDSIYETVCRLRAKRCLLAYSTVVLRARM
jgi:hypothetical protein